jgi:hypothetical protein
MSKVLTIKMLAERWSCSSSKAKTILREDKSLNGFKLGKSLWRVREEDVEAWEKRKPRLADMSLEGTEASSALSNGMRAENVAVTALRSV